MTSCEKREYVAFDRYVEKQPLNSDQRGGGGGGGGEGGLGEVWGAVSEACYRVYMIAPVKKFGRVRLSKQIWRRKQTWKDDEFLFSFKFSRVQTLRKGSHELF